jgi:hypothetical protein
MARVCFPDHLLTHTDGVRELEVYASSYRDLVTKLEERFSGISEVLLNKVAVAIDGEIIQKPFLEEIGPDSEVFFMARIEGG